MSAALVDEMIFMEPLGPEPEEDGCVYGEVLNTDLKEAFNWCLK